MAIRRGLTYGRLMNHPGKSNFGVKKHDVAHVPGPDYMINEIQ